jgi:hypothetical protein
MVTDLMTWSADWIAMQIFIVCFVFLGLTALFMWLWNTTLTELFDWPMLQYKQALKLMLMSAILFGTAGNLFSYSVTTTSTLTSDNEAEYGSFTETETKSKTTVIGIP